MARIPALSRRKYEFDSRTEHRKMAERLRLLDCKSSLERDCKFESYSSQMVMHIIIIFNKFFLSFYERFLYMFSRKVRFFKLFSKKKIRQIKVKYVSFHNKYRPIFLDFADSWVVSHLLLILIKISFFPIRFFPSINISLLILGAILSYKFNLLDKVKDIYVSLLKKILPSGTLYHS